MQPIHTQQAPDVIGPYSQGIRVGDTIFLSGQIPLDPITMQLCSNEIRGQINQVFENMSAVCEAAGGSLDHIVKLTVYLTDLSHFPLINEAMLRHFQEPYPARVAIGVNALPRDAQVEIEGVMILNTTK